MSKGLSHNYIGYTCGDVDNEQARFNDEMRNILNEVLEVIRVHTYRNCVHMSYVEIDQLINSAMDYISQAEEKVVDQYKKVGTIAMCAEFDYALDQKNDEIEELRSNHQVEIERLQDEYDRKISELENQIYDMQYDEAS